MMIGIGIPLIRMPALMLMALPIRLPIRQALLMRRPR